MRENPVKKIHEFVTYVRTYLSGDEKGQAQVFCDRLFQAFGHAGIFESGGHLEFRVHKGKGTKFADLLWPRRVLIEMKKRGEKLQKHFMQARDYWMYLTDKRPRYVALCNFDEFWIYDFDYQMDEPVDRVGLDELPERYTALNFLFPEERTPQFQNDLVAVTRLAADKVAQVFRLLVGRKDKPVQRDKAQRFILQCVIALFAEDIDLMPRGLFTELLADCKSGSSSYDLLGGLFRQMAAPPQAEGGRFQDVPYFNGGIFAIIDPIELKVMELTLLMESAQENWAKVNPAVFGTLFEASMNEDERHALGAHFTTEADIQKVVQPTIIRPWRERISVARNDRDLLALRKQLGSFRVLDAACGSGNFLYVAFRELRRLEWQLLSRLTPKARAVSLGESVVSAHQFFGIDIKGFAVELAKVTLMLAKKLALDERATYFEEQHLDFDTNELPLPLDNLDVNIVCDDALFCEWPHVDAIIGNPPYQSKNKMQQEFGPEYLQKVRAQFPDVPGRADYCVYWFRRAHDELPIGGRAGLVGTNTIRQNYSREGGLDYIVNNGGTITEAVSTQVWSGEAAVHVSIVNWIKGDSEGPKKLFFQRGDHVNSPWQMIEMETVNSALSASIDVSSAARLRANMGSGVCFQGQTHGHEGFLLSREQAVAILQADPTCYDVVLPYLTADELLSGIDFSTNRYVVDFHPRNVLQAGTYQEPFEIVKATVLPAREKAAKQEEARNGPVLRSNPKAKVNLHHRNFLNKWWLLSYPRQEMIATLATLPRYIVCGRITKRPIFEFVSSAIRPNDALQVFALPDDYSFGILQSGLHWQWFNIRCSTLKGDFRYTSDTVFDTFPWPQAPTFEQVQDVASAAVALRELRRAVMVENNWSLRELYRTLDFPGANPLRDAQTALDEVVGRAYDMDSGADLIAFLLEMNQQLSQREQAGEEVVAPGFPGWLGEVADFITADCVQPFQL